MDHLPTIYGAAVLLPLASFVTILLFARQLDKVAGSIATGAILVSAVLSFLGFGIWISNFPPMPAHHGGHEAAQEEHGADDKAHDHGAAHEKHSSVDSRSFHYVALLQEHTPSGAKTGSAHPEQAKEPDAKHGEHLVVERPVKTGEY